MILADNQAASAVGCYSASNDFETPNIDRLAAEGARLDAFYAASGYCSGGRATVMTGLMSSQHGVHSWLQDRYMDEWPKGWNAIQEFQSLPMTLKGSGYRTAHIGKWHLGDPDAASLGYEDWVTFALGHTVDFYDNEVIDNGSTFRLQGEHIVEYFSKRAVDHVTGAATDADRPFFLSVWYDGPYALPPTNMGEDRRNPYYEHFESKEFHSVPRLPVAANYVDQLKLEDYPNKPQRGELWDMILMQNDLPSLANFAAQCRLVDEGVGQIMAAVDNAGLAQNTLIVFSTDQGNFFGQHGRWGHASYSVPAVLYEEIMRVPFIARHPGRIPARTVVRELVGQYDIARTLTDWAGAGHSGYAHSPGRSFAPLLSGGSLPDWPDTVYFEQEEVRGLRTKQYAMWQTLPEASIFWREKGLDWDGSSMLFDMNQDLSQNNNLAQTDQAKPIMQELGARLSAFFDKYANPEFDLWKGGTVKGSIDFPGVYQRIHGPDWKPIADRRPAWSSAFS